MAKSIYIYVCPIWEIGHTCDSTYGYEMYGFHHDIVYNMDGVTALNILLLCLIIICEQSIDMNDAFP